jgi:3-oxoacyl-[acyl-carrier protein] reductase
MPVPPELLSLRGRIAWVTGASRGIGLACARLLAEQGASVVAVDLRGSTALEGIAQTFVALDVGDFPAVEKATRDLASRSLAPDILVNNAGIARDAVIWKMTEEQWDSVLRVDLKGAFNLIHHAAPLMRAHGRGGSIINIASINGLRGKFGQANYSAAKAGLIALTKTVARELGRFGVRVNAVAPGMVETEMTATLPADARVAALQETALGRLAQPADVAGAVLFLAGDLARHITGQIVQVDGGQYM